jgi:hypothetical protein
VKVKGHEEASLDVVIIRKLWPAALEVLFPAPSYQTSTSYGVPPPEFSRRIASCNSRPSMNLVNFSGSHWISRHCALAIQKKEKIFGWGGGGITGDALGPGVVQGTLGLLLLPTGRPGRRFTRTTDGDPAASGVVLFLLPRGRPRPHDTVGTPRFRQELLASAMEKSWETRNPRWKRRWCGGRGIYLGFLPSLSGSIYRQILMGLIWIKAHTKEIKFCIKQTIKEK